MTAVRSADSRAVPPAGLCDCCEHQVEVRNTRGSVFSLCGRSRTDPGYPRYPRLPVRHCAGYTPRASEERPAGEHPSGEHPSGEHPAGQHPAEEHPSGEHPSGEHPSGEHPADRRAADS
jgi:hypothetical protein